MKYDYKCNNCGKVKEVERDPNEKKEFRCPECRHKMTQVFGVSGVHYKAGGFHTTDSRPKARKGK